jgi:hypothetical protein
MARENQSPIARRPRRPPTFELKQFLWETPYRLLVSGTFGGLRELPANAEPVLIVRAGGSVHRLPAVPGTVDRPPENGRIWQAQFAWQDPPVGFRAAELQLGDLVVELPEPGARRRRERPRLLPVRRGNVGESEPPPDTMQVADDPRAVAAEARDDAAADGPGASLGSHVELLTAREEVREVRAAMQQIQAELSRARDDLQAERERRAGDGERFREGLANVRALAERALSDEQAVVNRLVAELREAEAALEAKDAALEPLRAELEAVDARRAEAEAALEAKDAALEPLRAQLEAADARRTEAETALETKDAAIEALRAQLEEAAARGTEAEAALEARDEAIQGLRSQLETARDAVEDARSDAERLIDRLTSVRGDTEDPARLR